MEQDGKVKLCLRHSSAAYMEMGDEVWGRACYKRKTVKNFSLCSPLGSVPSYLPEQVYLSTPTGALKLEQEGESCLWHAPLSEFGWDKKKRESRSGE